MVAPAPSCAESAAKCGGDDDCCSGLVCADMGDGSKTCLGELLAAAPAGGRSVPRGPMVAPAPSCAESAAKCGGDDDCCSGLVCADMGDGSKTCLGELLAAAPAGGRSVPRGPKADFWPFGSSEPPSPVKKVEDGVTAVGNVIEGILMGLEEGPHGPPANKTDVSHCMTDTQKTWKDIQTTVKGFENAFHVKKIESVESAFASLSAVANDFISIIQSCGMKTAEVTAEGTAVLAELQQPHGVIKVIGGDVFTIIKDGVDLTKACKRVYDDWHKSPRDYQGVGEAVGNIIADMLVGGGGAAVALGLAAAPASLSSSGGGDGWIGTGDISGRFGGRL
jgi:hypothetical protein